MNRQATIEDVATAAGVSVATVSRALRRLPNVAPSTRERVQRVANELDYVANPTASRLAGGRTGSVAVAVPAFDTWYFSKVVSGIDAVVKGDGIDLLLYAITDEPDRERFMAGRGAWYQRGDALVLVDILLEAEQAKRFADLGARIVTIGSRSRYFPSILLNEAESSAVAARHLVELGHTRIAIVTGEVGGTNFRVPMLREEGFRGALAELGLYVDSELIRSGGFSVDGGREAASQLLELSEPPSAVFALSDDMAIGVIAEARSRGLRVPDDLAVVGFDDNEMADVFDLTTVHQDVDEIGASAGRLVRDLMTSVDKPVEHHESVTSLIIRASTIGDGRSTAN